jgi:hypothetical protein
LGGAAVGQSLDTDADAQGSLVTGGDAEFVLVGVARGGGGTSTPEYNVGDATGSATVGGFAQTAVVGSVDSDGSAVGYLEAEGISPVLSSSAGSVSVGVSTEGSGTAEGHVVIRSGGIDAKSVSIGRLDDSLLPSGAAANATVAGILESTGDVTTRLSGGDKVGYANANSGGAADGTWILHDATYTSHRLMVGVNEGTGIATGRMHLDRTLADLADLTLGGGATIELEMRGAVRGTGYSAIDAAVAKLDGVLAVQFVDFAQEGVYDLIVSGGPDGITGDFDAVSITGLTANQHAFWGIETIGDATPVEVFRLYVVPEPTTGSLFCFGLSIVEIRRRRSR